MVKAANTATISDNGKTATLTIPLTATITDDTVLREEISVTPMSSLYGTISWNKQGRKFNDHQLLFRVTKNVQVPIIVEVLHDQYTCSYNNPNSQSDISQQYALSSVNSGYIYALLLNAKNIPMPHPNRTAIIDDNASWLQNLDGNYFLDMRLNITFPTISQSNALMNNGGLCQGSVSLLVSRKL
ncbi:hypothetical protein ACVQ8I_00560 [Edwardsiella tarda]